MRMVLAGVTIGARSHTHIVSCVSPSSLLTQEGGTYVPVAELPPIPEPHGMNEEGKLVPLPNAQPVFLTGVGCCVLVCTCVCGGMQSRDLLTFACLCQYNYPALNITHTHTLSHSHTPQARPSRSCT